jgi:hypothetical protein
MGAARARYGGSLLPDLSRDDILNPVGIITNDQAYELTVTSTKGCIAKDSVSFGGV